MAVKLAGTHPSGKLLDYGCGDGTFIDLVAGNFAACVGADVAPDQLADCRDRFATVHNVKFCLVDDLAGAEHTQAYAVVTCMETLEHCIEPVVDKVLMDLKRLCEPGGTVIISVPVETGVVFFIKYFVRKMAAWRGLSHYAQYENYSMRDALRMAFATAHTAMVRPVYGEPGSPYHSHYGFNWRRLRTRVARQFQIERTLFSPMRALGGWMSSQVWLACRPPNRRER